jgi:acyl-CoA thioesterase
MELGLAKALELAPDAHGRLRGAIPEGWKVVVGIHGGLQAALLTKAAKLAAGPDRRLRSISIHFIRPARAGAITIDTEVVREGTGLTSMSLRLEQDGEPVALALAAAGIDRESEPHDRLPIPVSGPPEDFQPIPYIDGLMPQFMEHAELRMTSGGGPGNPSADGTASVSAWMRPIGDGPLDEPAVAFLSDFAWPTVFALRGEVSGAPTIDLTIHFRSKLPPEGEDGWAFGQFESRLGRDGYFEEDGVLWSRDGTPLAHSRQLALTLPLPTGAFKGE